MSITEIKAIMKTLSLEERRQLSAYLVSLRHSEIKGYRESLTAKIYNDVPDFWVSFAEFNKRTAL